MKIGNSVAVTDIPAKMTGSEPGRVMAPETKAIYDAALVLADGQAVVVDCETPKEAGSFGARGRSSAFRKAGLTSAVRGLQVFIYRNGASA